MNEKDFIKTEPDVKKESQELLEQNRPGEKIIDMFKHRALKARQGEKMPEFLQEDELIGHIVASSLVVVTRQNRSWDRVRDASGPVLADTDDGNKNFEDLRTPRRRLDSQRGLINQIRGRLNAAVRTGTITTLDELIPWTSVSGDTENVYDKNFLFLTRNPHVRAFIEKYRDFAPDTPTDRERLALDVLSKIKQCKHDHVLFTQLFGEEKNPGLYQALSDREQGVKRKKQKPSKDKREREKARIETGISGAQMRVILEYEGARITFDRNRGLWTLMSISDPKRILPEQGREKILGATFAADLSDAPGWLREIAREKGL